MDLKITEKFENQLLDRTDLSGEINFSGATPSNINVAKEIANNLKCKEDLVVVKQILTKFSTSFANFKAVAYKTPEGKAKFEVTTKYLKAVAAKKAKEEAEKKAAELEAKKKAEEEAKKAEENKEEAPAEEKSE